MKLRCLYAACAALFFSVAVEADADVVGAPKVTFPVRVLLAEAKKIEPFVWELSSPQGFILKDAATDGIQEEIETSTLTISLKKGSLAVNGRRLAVPALVVMPRQGHITYKSCAYTGSLLIVCAEGKDPNCYLINTVDLEDYLFSVVRWEGWPGWPVEVNRVFAIMCRTYVVYKVLQERKKTSSTKYFDIKNTNIHQTYKGTHEFNHLRQALDDTAGIVMTYEGKPIEAMYDACCGGVIPADMSGIDFKKAPYLKRDYACPYCKSTKLYRWKIEYQLSDLEDLIAQGVENGVPIRDIRVTKKDKAGVVHEIQVKTNSATYALTGKKIYSLLKDLKSFCFDVEKKGKKVTFTGRGFGHHLGVCQWGVRQMVREKEKERKKLKRKKLAPKDEWRDILKFYYPGISFMSIEVVE
jgi:stage II sporulation protein D